MTAHDDFDRALAGWFEADAVRRMKGGDEDLGIIGSGALVRALARAGLVDTFLLLVHPLVLGTGQRLGGRRADSRRWA